MLRKIGLLWNEHQPGELLEGTTQPREQHCCKQCHQLVRDLLYNSTSWGFSSWCLLWKILDHRQLHDNLYFCKKSKNSSAKYYILGELHTCPCNWVRLCAYSYKFKFAIHMLQDFKNLHIYHSRLSFSQFSMGMLVTWGKKEKRRRIIRRKSNLLVSWHLPNY